MDHLSGHKWRLPGSQKRDQRANLFWLTEPPERHCARNQIPTLRAIDEASLRIIHLAVQVVWRDDVHLDAERRNLLCEGFGKSGGRSARSRRYGKAGFRSRLSCGRYEYERAAATLFHSRNELLNELDWKNHHGLEG